jgi:DNA-directed RNA polymerase subunit RPC12/RpoP
MDISFKCPHCDQELEVDSSGAGSTIECPACSNTITVPGEPVAVIVAAEAVVEEVPPAPAKAEKHFSVPVRDGAAPTEKLIQKPNRPLEVTAKDDDKTLRIKTYKRGDCAEVGHDRFDEVVSAFLEKVGKENIISISPINYSYTDLSSRAILTDYGVMIVFRG